MLWNHKKNVDIVDIIEIVHAVVMVQSQKRDMDSVVIYQGFCGYIPRILWLLLSTCDLRDASASKNITYFAIKIFSTFCSSNI